MLVPFIDHSSLGYDAPLGASVIGDIAKLGVAGDVYLNLPPQTRTEKGLGYLKPLLHKVSTRVGPFLPGEVDIATLFLDAGAHFVAFDVNASGGEAAIELVAEALASLPRQRVLIHVHEGVAAANGVADGTPQHASLSDSVTAAVVALRDLVAGVIVAAPPGEIHSDYHKALRTAAGAHTVVCVRPLSGAFRPVDLGRLHRHDIGVVYPAFVATGTEEIAAAGPECASPKLDVGTCMACCARSDRPDGLFTTVVSDECGKALGLVYSSAASVAESIRCGRGVYYSRSR